MIPPLPSRERTHLPLPRIAEFDWASSLSLCPILHLNAPLQLTCGHLIQWNPHRVGHVAHCEKSHGQHDSNFVIACDGDVENSYEVALGLLLFVLVWSVSQQRRSAEKWAKMVRYLYLVLFRKFALTNHQQAYRGMDLRIQYALDPARPGEWAKAIQPRRKCCGVQYSNKRRRLHQDNSVGNVYSSLLYSTFNTEFKE